MRRILILSIMPSLVLVSTVALAQSTGILFGKVINKETKVPLPGASVLVVGTPFGASADKDGAYRFQNLPVGQHTVTARYVGYTSRTKSVEVVVDEERQLDFSLEETALPGQTIVVTASLGHERETPATFSNLTAQEVKERYMVQDLPALLSELPSTTYYSESGNSVGYNYISIRGFDQRRLAVMINGIPQNDPEDHNVYWVDFPDLTANLGNVQVQRGAGSAFYGPPAIGGSVNLVTTSFTGQRQVNLFGGYGTYNTRKYSVALSSGLIDNQYSIYGRLARIKSAGYRERSWVDFDGYFLGAVRFDENMTTQLNFYGGPIADHLSYYGIPKSYIGDRTLRRTNFIARDEEIENFSQPHYELLHEWRLSDRLTLNNTFFFVSGEGFYDYDGSWADTSYFRLTAANGFHPMSNPENALIRAFVDNKQYGWLPRMTYRHANGEFTGGAEIRLHRSFHWGRIQWAQNLSLEVPEDFHYYEYNGRKDIVSVYGQEIYRLRPDLTLMLNLQYVYNRYRLYNEKFIGTDFSVPYNFLNPRIGLNYNISNEWNAYVSVSRTSHEPRLKNFYDAAESSGGETPQFEMRADGSYSFDKPLVLPEKLNDVELGLAYSSEKLRVGANLFWMDFHDEIIKQGGLDRFGQPRTGNATRTRHQGVELTGLVRFDDHLELTGNLSLSKNELVSYKYFLELENLGTGQSEVVGVLLDGNRIAGFPDVIANARLTYRNAGLTASLALQFVGNQFTDNFGDMNVAVVNNQRYQLKTYDNKVDAYTVVNFASSYQIGEILGLNGLELKLQVNNLFDKLYAMYGNEEEFFPAAERHAFLGISLNL
jgi:iron complex outermembrane receptor protein